VNFFDTLTDKFSINLNEQQKKAVSHVTGPALILAGPGSGKTTVITARAAYLILHSGIKPQNILTLTFNKAAQLEMERRFNRLYGNVIEGKVHFATIHSFCNRVIRDYERMKGQKLRRIEGSDEEINKKHLLKDIYLNINNSKIGDDEIESLINEIGYVKNKMIKDLDGITFSTKKFSQVFKAYEEYKKSKLMIDFDDMLTYAYSILTKCPEILNYYRNRYQFIQVDEGQDLSKIQFEVMKLLIADSNNFFIVADDDQSIYGFRGAEPQYILDIEKQFKNCNIFRLENNYRSSKNIVELSSTFIKQNNNRFDKNHTTLNPAKFDPIILNPEDEQAQLILVLDKIKQDLAQNKSKDNAILYRNNLSSILIADILDRNEIPFKIKQNKLFFFNHWLVQDVVAFLMFALDQHDIEAFSKIYYRMNRYISKAMLECVVGSANESVIDCIMKNIDLKQFQINTLLELKLEFSSLSKKRPWAALEYIKNNFKYLENIKEYCEFVGLSFEYLNKLFGILQRISVSCQTISSFLIRLQELNQLFEGPTSTKSSQKLMGMPIEQPIQKLNVVPSKITLSTFHSSKGLEYDCVFMIDLNNSEIPGDKALDKALENKDKSLVEEERRLFYVGMTRARHELYLVFPASLNNQKVLRSVFVNEVIQLVQKDIIDGIGEGVIVQHVKFGKGIVVAINGSQTEKQTIEIKFLSGQQKTLDLEICLDNKLLIFD
jgi:DNA helicase II / ATP-dependent DNA helicase PcrA